MTLIASTTSLRLTSPMSAILMGTSFCLRLSTIASRLPRVSVFNMMPTFSVWTLRRSISEATSSTALFRVMSPPTARRADPGIASSMSGAAILIPEAAWASLMLLNFLRGSLISSRGWGTSMALILVVIGPSLPPITIVSSAFRVPS